MLAERGSLACSILQIVMSISRMRAWVSIYVSVAWLASCWSRGFKDGNGSWHLCGTVRNVLVVCLCMYVIGRVNGTEVRGNGLDGTEIKGLLLK